MIIRPPYPIASPIHPRVMAYAKKYVLYFVPRRICNREHMANTAMKKALRPRFGAYP